MELIISGIGSRETPESDGNRMKSFAHCVTKNNGIMRSGGAPGADTFFAAGVSDPNRQEIFLPFKNFNGVQSGVGIYILQELHLKKRQAAEKIAEKFHPNWAAVQRNPTVVSLMTRNVFQVLGCNLNTPSDLVVMWAKGTRNSIAKKNANNRIVDVPGGTGLAVRLAAFLEIPVLHTSLEEHINLLKQYEAGDFSGFTESLYNEGKWDKSVTKNRMHELLRDVGFPLPNTDLPAVMTQSEKPASAGTGRWVRTFRKS